MKIISLLFAFLFFGHAWAADSPPEGDIPLASVKQNVSKKKIYLPYQRYRLQGELGFEYLGLTSQNKMSGQEANFGSSLTPGLSLAWFYQMSERMAFSLGGKLRKDGILEPLASGTTIQGGDGYRHGIWAEVNYLWKTRAISALEIGRDQKLFARAVSANLVSMDKLLTTRVTISHRQPLVKLGGGDLGARLFLSWLGPMQGSGYEVDRGHDAGLAGYYQWKVGFTVLAAEAYCRQATQESAANQQRETSLGASLNISWSLMKPLEP